MTYYFQHSSTVGLSARLEGEHNTGNDITNVEFKYDYSIYSLGMESFDIGTLHEWRRSATNRSKSRNLKYALHNHSSNENASIDDGWAVNNGHEAYVPDRGYSPYYGLQGDKVKTRT